MGIVYENEKDGKHHIEFSWHFRTRLGHKCHVWLTWHFQTRPSWKCHVFYTNKYIVSQFCSFFSGKDEGAESKRRRVCRSGAGIEVTAGKGDTEGFPLRTEPKVVRDVRGFKRLELSRDNRRTVQSSTFLLQGWRANCDIQILLYDSDPSNPDPADVAKVTDYVVAYACKGNDALQPEKAKLKGYILNLREDAMTENVRTEAKTLARKILNKSISEKVISKQECMVQLAGLHLHLCSEVIQTVSISGSYRLSEDDIGCKGTSFFQKYKVRKDLHHLSLDDYFHFVKNRNLGKGKREVIPHYVGGCSTPVFPATLQYARSVLLIYKPWNTKFPDRSDIEMMAEFERYIVSFECPMKVKIPYSRARQRVITGTHFAETTSQVEVVNYSEFSLEISSESADAVAIASTFGVDGDEQEQLLDYKYDRGLNYNWSKQHVKV